MTRLGLAALLLVAACSREEPSPTPTPTPAPTPDLPPHQVFPTAREALDEILKSSPRVIGFGEYHQTNDSLGVRSAIKRFTEEMLAALAETGSDLIVETWAEYGTCGEQEAKVSKDVKKVTERPPTTENEVLTLLGRAKELGIAPRVLPFDCDDYEQLLGKDGEVDYEKLLTLITGKLQTAATEALARRSRKGRRLIALYGGSLHNDLYPDEGVADFSYATKVQEKTAGGYVEVDLYVPELVAGDKLLAQEPWYPLLEQRASIDHVVLFERDKGSYILILKKGVRAD